MAVSGTAQDEAIVGINVTPLVDITLVLLIIFMVTAKIIVSQAVPLDLPKAATAGEVQAVFVVDVDKDARISVDGKRIENEGALVEAARAALVRAPDVRTVVQASSAVPHGVVIHVLDQLRKGGIQKIAFGVDPLPKEVLP
jgi:biopolymer transport protein ExbD